ncbi:hypothetical protein BU16DRAFT_132116 [Lophium mytilinum]|uniref:Uncharacterized protein n=1 Tax=Lophium mytilinum TaxID=390894 RepID=A0A6A6QEJ9_9PEZI|nr:hypothetical protein BU16DRAFT_132116 [Lophium mytilinum]
MKRNTKGRHNTLRNLLRQFIHRRHPMAHKHPRPRIHHRYRIASSAYRAHATCVIDPLTLISTAPKIPSYIVRRKPPSVVVLLASCIVTQMHLLRVNDWTIHIRTRRKEDRVTRARRHEGIYDNTSISPTRNCRIYFCISLIIRTTTDPSQPSPPPPPVVAAHHQISPNPLLA